MSEISSNLHLPFLMPAQAQKHVTHNEALLRLDGLVHLSILGVVDDMPAAPNEGDCVIISDSPASGLTGGSVHHFADGAWKAYMPKSGWRAWDSGVKALRVFDDGIWSDVTSDSETAEFEQLGINTAPDTINRLSIKSPASLFDHDGDDHRMTINKSAAADTASFLFQSGYNGHAEMGLTGDNNFHAKVSGDGVTFTDAFDIDKDTAVMRLPQGMTVGTGVDVLSVYATGIWTPTIFGTTTAGTPSYGGQGGAYVRLGKFVFASCELSWTDLGGAAGQMRIGGLPFQLALGIENRAAISIGWYNNIPLPMGKSALKGFAQPYSDYVRLWWAAAAPNSSSAMVTQGDLPNTGEIYFTLCYMCV